MRTWLGVGVAVACVGLLAVRGMAQNTSEMERELFQDLNRARAQAGVAPLRWDERLAQAARVHSQRMAEENQLSHQLEGEPDVGARLGGEGAHFDADGENVGVGPGAQALDEGWMGSPPHRKNMLNPAYDAVGIGVARRGAQFYATEDFAHAVAALSVTGAENAVASELRRRGVAAMAGAAAAREACTGREPMAGRGGPDGYFRFTTSDPRRLPRQLVRMLGEGYTRAEVGACPRTDMPSGFTGVQVEVLLYR